MGTILHVRRPFVDDEPALRDGRADPSEELLATVVGAYSWDRLASSSRCYPSRRVPGGEHGEGLASSPTVIEPPWALWRTGASSRRSRAIAAGPRLNTR